MFDFPASPVLDQVFTAAGVSYKWNGYAWIQISGGAGVSDGDKGDIVVSNIGTTWMFDSAVVTNTAKTVLDDTTTAAMLTTLAAAPIASPTFTGIPAAPTATAGTSTTQLATTAFVTTADAGKAPLVHTHTESEVTNLVSDLALKAPLASPTFTGTPAAPTPAQGTNTTQIATTAFVANAVTVGSGAYLPLSGGTLTGVLQHPPGTAAAPSINFGNATTGIYSSAANNIAFTVSNALYVTIDSGKMNVLLPILLNGDPSAPFHASTKNYVDTQVATKANVSHTHPQSDITNLVADLALKAPLASPALTGTPTVPTAAAGTNTTQAASTAFVTAALAAAPGATIADAAPSSPTQGQFWWESDTGKLFIFFIDVTGPPGQWIQVNG